jgi:chemotaxis protein methyltransferase CheR
MASELRDVDFEKISRLIYEKCGINLHDGKKELVTARLGKRLREGNFRSFADYYSHVTTEAGTEELVRMIDSISTNLTFFFREESHFSQMCNILPSMCEMVAKEHKRPRLRIWSAGCSTGEEPYSLAITALECLGNQSADVKILATDISTIVLKTAANGMYTEDKTKNIPPALLKKYFQRGTGKMMGYNRVNQSIRDMVSFKRFNLMDVPPVSAVFDVIFCRNVMIYFDKVTQQTLINNFYNRLAKGGYFFIGHSESLTSLSHDFKYTEPSIYRK